MPSPPPVALEPFRGAKHTVAAIRKLALAAQQDYDLRLLAEEVVGRLAPKDYLSEILALYTWVCCHVRYANDPRTVELVRSPRESLSRMRRTVTQLRGAAGGRSSGWRPSLDCDDITTLLCGLFLALGREVRIVTVAFRDAFVGSERQYQHVYLQVREPRTGAWIVLDPVAAEKTREMLSRVRAVKIWPVA